MASNQNLFEKYGIKEVADVTLFRIEEKEETYESQRTISIASILKGAIGVQTVYPMENGISSDEGFDAYVFIRTAKSIYYFYKRRSVATS